jgi:hypothetical protein
MGSIGGAELPRGEEEAGANRMVDHGDEGVDRAVTMEPRRSKTQARGRRTPGLCNRLAIG